MTTDGGPCVGTYAPALRHERVGDETVPLWQVADLERHVDREALLADENPAEPPYWAYLWSGARVLAEVVPPAQGRGIELGCGLALPGITAARRGTRMLLVDRVRAPLVYARASAAANGLTTVETAVTDVTSPALRGQFDLVLAAELLYERVAFRALADAMAVVLAPRGIGLLTDAGRIDTADFYPALEAAGLHWEVREVTAREEGVPVRIRIVTFGHAAAHRPNFSIFR